MNVLRRHSGIRYSGMGNSQAGFTVLELLLVFVISALALTLASGLLLEAQSRMTFEAEKTLRPVADLAVEQLRADLRVSTGVVPIPFGGWTWDPMVLTGHPAGRVSYEKFSGRLVRRVERDGEVLGERPVLDRVGTFRWRRSVGGAIDLELGYQEDLRLSRLTAGGAWDEPVTVERQRILKVLPRGGGGKAW